MSQSAVADYLFSPEPDRTIGMKRYHGGAVVSRRPAYKKRRVMRAVSRVPRAIATRGTPQGYYEIPVSVFRKVYWNMSTGLWETAQSTGTPGGVTGYNGFSFYTALDGSYMALGNGSFSAQNNINVPGFTEMQAVFDQCKVVRIDYEFWFSNQSHEVGTAAHDNPELFIVKDFDSADPPGSLAEVLQYQKVARVLGNANNGVYKVSIYPKVRTSVGASADEAGTSTTLAGVESSGYQDCQKPGCFHFGLRGWFNTNSSQGATLGYLHVMERQIRRYKITK